MKPPNSKKPIGANAYFLYINGAQWCEVISHNFLRSDCYEIRPWRNRTQTWNKNPKWVEAHRIVLVDYKVTEEQS